MGPSPLLAVYLAPAVLVLLSMIRARSFSFHQVYTLGRQSRRTTLDDWLAVFAYLGVGLESRNQPPKTKPPKPWRLTLSGAAFAASLVLYQFILPLNIPISFAQHLWNAFPAIQVAIAGVALAFSLMLAFHRPRRWLLVEQQQAEYPYPKWAVLQKERGRSP
jgi:hypothetical protein